MNGVGLAGARAGPSTWEVVLQRQGWAVWLDQRLWAAQREGMLDPVTL